jgi:hypothetical protein
LHDRFIEWPYSVMFDMPSPRVNVMLVKYSFSVALAVSTDRNHTTVSLIHQKNIRQNLTTMILRQKQSFTLRMITFDALPCKQTAVARALNIYYCCAVVEIPYESVEAV